MILRIFLTLILFGVPNIFAFIGYKFFGGDKNIEITLGCAGAGFLIAVIACFGVAMIWAPYF
jgi:hypothetical protein